MDQRFSRLGNWIFPGLFLFLGTALAFAQTPDTAAGMEDSSRWQGDPRALTGEFWLEHLRDDLLPFWDTAEALGTPPGNFPTRRTMDGRVLDEQQQRYPRMLSRQVFAYSVGYLMTGEARYLEHARLGAEWLMDHAWDQDHGGWFALLEADGTPVPDRPKYAQDMAYAVQGLGMYYFITRDSRAEEFLLRTHGLIFDPEAFWMDTWDWIQDGMTADLSQSRDQEGGGWELVAGLDQINAYMLLAQPVLSRAEDRERWAGDLVNLGHSMIRHFWRDGIFWGQKDRLRMPGRHVDFGHTFKSYWMLWQIDQRLGRQDFRDFVLEHSRPLLERAFDQEYGMWASSPGRGGTVRYGSNWWIYSESDQLTASLNMSLEGVYDSILERTGANWGRYYVDTEHGEVFEGVRRDGSIGEGWPVDSTSKVWEWKNGYHSHEHALIMYLHAQERQDEPAVLYFAPAALEYPGARGPQEEQFPVRPYLFEGDEILRRVEGRFALGNQEHLRMRVEFRNIH